MQKKQAIEKMRKAEEAPWAKIMALLSMDVVFPFQGLMGLVVPDPRSLISALRDSTLRSRREHDANPEVVPYWSAQRVLDDIEVRLGTSVREEVVWWGACIFDNSPHDHPDLNAWTNLLRYCGSDATLWEGFTAEARSRVLSESKRAGDMTGYEILHEEVYTKPLTDWDLHIYSLFHFDDEDELSPNGPDMYVYATIRTFQAYRFWAWVRRFLDPAQQGVLYKNALQIVQRPNNQALMGGLPPLAALEIGL